MQTSAHGGVVFVKPNKGLPHRKDLIPTAPATQSWASWCEGTPKSNIESAVFHLMEHTSHFLLSFFGPFYDLFFINLSTWRPPGGCTGGGGAGGIGEPSVGGCWLSRRRGGLGVRSESSLYCLIFPEFLSIPQIPRGFWIARVKCMESNRRERTLSALYPPVNEHPPPRLSFRHARGPVPPTWFVPLTVVALGGTSVPVSFSYLDRQSPTPSLRNTTQLPPPKGHPLPSLAPSP